MQLSGKDVADFLSGANTIRDGRLIGLLWSQGDNEGDAVLKLTFDVPAGTEGDLYDLTLWGELSFDYGFSRESTLQQIAFVKCVWLDDATFYLSLDPWKESERAASEQDNDCFRSTSVTLKVRDHVR
jgi:hypothetical protein